MTDFVTERLAEYLEDDDLYFRECLVIRDHDTAQLLPFEMNYGQLILHEVCEKQKAEMGRVRVLLLKSRRFGGSTYTEARCYKRTSLNENQNTFIVGHEEESTKTLFNMAKLFQERNPIAPAILASNAQELRFDNKQGTGLKSEYRLATARNTSAGRSQGIHYLHISEEAFWEGEAENLLLGLFQCVPDPPAYSEIIRESTAKGYGNTFQRDVFKAYADGRYPYYAKDGRTYAWKSPDTDWVLVFIPWFAIEKYTMEIPAARRAAFEVKVNEKEFDRDNLKWVDSESMMLKQRFNLSLEQLYWRDWAIENKCGGSVDKFHQEYPSTVYEAFLSKGSNTFPRWLCDMLEAQCDEPVTVGDVVRSTGKTRIQRNKHGSFTVWEECNQNDGYYLTVDVAGGLLEGGRKKTEKDEPDKTNIDVWNHRTGNQAAQWNGHMDYDMVADLISMIGELYGINLGNKLRLPIAAVELNNHGFTVVADLKKMGYPQFKYDGKNYGWQTNRRTKPQMIDEFYKAVRDASLKINSLGTIGEMRTYIEEHGKFAAAAGCNDDRVITGAIAAKMLTELPRHLGKAARSKGGACISNLRDGHAPDHGGYEEYYAN